jgi:hypothetical protein
MKKITFQHKETLSLKTVLGDSLSMYKLKSTIPEHVAPIEIFVITSLICVVWYFSKLEYILRIAFIHKRLRYSRSIMELIDLSALLPD